MPTEQQLNRESLESIDRLERGAEQVQREFREVLRDFSRRIEIAAADLSRADFATVAEYELAVQAFFNDSGGEELIENYLDTMLALEDEATGYYRLFDIQPRLNSEAAEMLNFLIEYHEVNLRELVDDRIVRPLRNTILLANTTDTTPDALRDNIRAELDRYEITTASGTEFTDNQVETLLREGIVQYNRQVNEEVAQEVGFQIYQYFGPQDGKTRDACQVMGNSAPHGVPGMYYRDEVEAFTSQLNLPFPALTGAGGYNCRHRWVAVSLEYAQEQGFIPRG